MIHFNWVWEGGFGIRYLFDNIGEALPAHAHDAETEHTVEVVRGYAVVETHNTIQTAGAGTTIRFDSTVQHIVRALEPGTIIINRFINGEPESYKALSENEHSGTLDPSTYGRRAELQPEGQE